MGNIFAIIFLIIWVFVALKLGGLLSKFKIPSVLAALVLGFIVSYHFLGHFIPIYGSFAKAAQTSIVYKIMTGLGLIGIGIYMGISFKKDTFKKSAAQIIGMPILSTIIVVLIVTIVMHFAIGTSWMLSFLIGTMSSAAIPAYPIATIKEFKASGDVSVRSVPMASVDMAVGFLVFMVASSLALGYYHLVSAPIYYVLLMFIGSGIFGAIFAFVLKEVMKHINNTTVRKIAFVVLSIISVLVASIINKKLGYSFFLEPVYALSTGIIFANSKDVSIQEKIFPAIMPIIWILLVMNIFIIGANINVLLLKQLTGVLLMAAILFLVARFVSKYFSYYIGGKIFKAPQTVCQNMGIALLGFCANGAFFVFYLGQMLQSAHGNPVVYDSIHLMTFATVVVMAAGIINDIIAVPINPIAFRKEIGK